LIWKPHVTVAGVIEKEGRFLLVEERIKGRLVLNQPAGHLEANETLLEAVVRETREETAWEIEPVALLGVHRLMLANNGDIYLRFNFAGRALKHYPDEALDTGIERALWLDYETLLRNSERHRSPLVLQAVEDFLQGTSYPLTLLQDFAELPPSP
jgi:ADP-ribose pyrophosphatase YjhB (NUDIX family)